MELLNQRKGKIEKRPLVVEVRAPTTNLIVQSQHYTEPAHQKYQRPKEDWEKMLARWS